MLPEAVKTSLDVPGLNLLQMCKTCEGLFTGDLSKGVKTICAVCGDFIQAKDKNRRAVKGKDGEMVVQTNSLRKFASATDYMHDNCRRNAARGAPPLAKKKKFARFKYSVNGTDCTYNQGELTMEEDALLGLLASRKIKMGISLFKVPVPREGLALGAGQGLTLAHVPGTRGKSNMTSRRRRNTMVRVAGAMAENSPVEASAVIKDVALHSQVGKTLKLTSSPDQLLDLDEVTMECKSFAKSRRIMSLFRKAGGKSKQTLKQQQQDRLARRQAMSFKAEKVYHPSFLKQQTLYVKRAVDLCDIVAHRMARIFESDSFIELDGVAYGEDGSIYWSFVVRCVCNLSMIINYNKTILLMQLQARCRGRVIQDSVPASQRGISQQNSLGNRGRSYV
jgi:hypothetical protein